MSTMAEPLVSAGFATSTGSLLTALRPGVKAKILPLTAAVGVEDRRAASVQVSFPTTCSSRQ